MVLDEKSLGNPMLPLYLLLPLALIASIWCFVLFRKTGLVGGCLATLFCGSCLGHSLVHVSLVTTDRLLLVGLVVGYLLARNLYGLKVRTLGNTDIAMAAFIFFLTYNTFAGDWKWAAGRPVSLLLFFYLMPFALYWVASRCQITEQSHRWILGFFVGFGIYLSLTAVCEVLNIYAVVFPRYITDPNTIEFLGRGRGPFLNPIGNGMYLSACLIATLMWWPYVKKAHQPFVVGVAGLIALGAVCTLTRSVWLGAGAALVGMAVLVVPTQHRLRVVLVAAISGGLALGLLGSSLVAFKRDKHLTAKETEDSAKLRPILAAFAYEIFQDYPLTGVGLSQYKRHNVDYLTKRSFDLPMGTATTYVQHNIFLSLLVETGLIGVSLFCVVLLFWVKEGWTLWYAKDLPLWQRQFGMFSVLMVAAYFPNGMFHEMSVIPMLNMLMFFVAGLSRNMMEQVTAKESAGDVRQSVPQSTTQFDRRQVVAG